MKLSEHHLRYLRNTTLASYMEQYDSVVDGMRDFNIMCVSTMAARSKGMAVKAIGIGLTSPSGWTQSH